jgi:signal peptidase complex subunit 2
VAVALYSHFGPGKFPANWWTVAACVAAYVAINVVLMIFSAIKEGDSFLVTPPKPVSGAGVGGCTRWLAAGAGCH